MTVAHEIKYPWYHNKPWPKALRRDPSSWGRKQAWNKMTPEQQASRSQLWPEGYRNTFLTVWHVDPERGGSDDSCGYSRVRLTKHQIERLRNACWHEAKHPHFLRCRDKEWSGSLEEVESLYRGLVFLVCLVMRIKVTLDEVALYAIKATHVHDCGKAGSAFCFLPGYHSNNVNDSESDREDYFHGILCNVASQVLTNRRPWWKHPKWHFWHWKFQCHPLQTFKQWAFSRCSKCGKGFSWGYCPCTNSWNGTGPLWFRSEKDTFHSDCDRPKDPDLASAEPTTTQPT